MLPACGAGHDLPERLAQLLRVGVAERGEQGLLGALARLPGPGQQLQAGLGQLDDGGFGLTHIELDVYAPNVERDAAEAVVAKAHTVCPYSNATRGNVEVTLTVV